MGTTIKATITSILTRVSIAKPEVNKAKVYAQNRYCLFYRFVPFRFEGS